MRVKIDSVFMVSAFLTIPMSALTAASGMINRNREGDLHQRQKVTIVSMEKGDRKEAKSNGFKRMRYVRVDKTGKGSSLENA